MPKSNLKSNGVSSNGVPVPCSNGVPSDRNCTRITKPVVEDARDVFAAAVSNKDVHNLAQDRTRQEACWRDELQRMQRLLAESRASSEYWRPDAKRWRAYKERYEQETAKTNFFKHDADLWRREAGRYREMAIAAMDSQRIAERYACIRTKF